MDPKPEVPTLLYIVRRGRIIERAIGLRDWVHSLLHLPWLALAQQIDPIYRPDTPTLACLGDWSCQPLWASSLVAAGPIASWWSHIRVVQVHMSHISYKKCYQCRQETINHNMNTERWHQDLSWSSLACWQATSPLCWTTLGGSAANRYQTPSPPLGHRKNLPTSKVTHWHEQSTGVSF
jgi:hypothetical protein